MIRPSRVAWRAPGHELVLLALVAAAALAPVYRGTDVTRVCLSQAVLHGRLWNDSCLASTSDRSIHGGHLYTDQAPGVSLLEVPSVAVLGSASGLRQWGVRLLSVGVAFLVSAFLVGRIGEALAPGFGGLALVGYSLGTLMGPFAATSLDSVLAASLGFGAFVLAWSRRGVWAGLAAGMAVVVRYDSALILAAVAAYVALRGVRSLGWFALGTIPGLALLGAYNWAAFGTPWRFSYSYIQNGYSANQSQGVFGISLPNLFSTVEVLAGNRGLLVVSPVVLFAGYGLVLLWRERPAEAAVCTSVAAAFLLVNVGYFLPYGGLSAGPRFLIPGLPFLAVGLGPAARRLPRSTALATGASVIAMTALMLVWTSHATMRQTIWGELARVPLQLGHSRFVENLTRTIPEELLGSRVLGAVAASLCAIAALGIAVRGVPRPWFVRTRLSLVGAAFILAVVGADACAAYAYPYAGRTFTSLPDLTTSISGSRTSSLPGDEVDFTISVANTSLELMPAVSLGVDLTPGMQLLGPPAVERGPGCTETNHINCNLGDLPAHSATQIKLGVRITQGGTQRVRASSNSAQNPGANRPVFPVVVGE